MSELYHYGIKRRSGRYPYGSGENPYQHEGNFLAKIKELRKEGLSEKEIAEHFNMSTRELKAEITIANDRVKTERRNQVMTYYNQGKGPTEIGRIMGLPESTVRSIISPKEKKNKEALSATSDAIRKAVDDKRFVDIGEGVAASMGITQSRFDAAVQALKKEGYQQYELYVRQPWADGDQYTIVKVLAAPGVEKSEAYFNRGNIGIIDDHFVDQHSAELDKLKPVKSISSDRVAVRYGDEGGLDKDGVIEIRRGAEGLDLGEARYAQVRIAVDDTHYLKGMAIYSDDLPDGVDILFNANKRRADCKSDLDAMKTLKGSLDDPTQAFETAVKKGGQRGYLNIVNEEGDWSKWSVTISSQVLSKQTPQLASRQLEAARLAREAELDEIMSLTNPVVKQHMLDQFATKCDAAAVKLKAAGVPRQASKVILPVTSLKPNEVYAPSYRDGETVVLIRHPHGGTFEIPELTVNNHNKEAQKLFQNAQDAVGIHPSVSSKLSGADFDGDTVLVIPNNDRSFKTSPSLKDLEGFEPKVQYHKSIADQFTDAQLKSAADRVATGEKLSTIAKEYGVTTATLREAMPVKHATGQIEMGIVTNLIADMTIKGAKSEEIARAVKYSMVVIDAEKHNLDYRQARKDCNIEDLQRKYQPKPDGGGGGASTLISRAGATVRVPKQKRSYKPDPETGKYTYEDYDKSNDAGWYTNRDGERVQKTTKTSQMRNVSQQPSGKDDAHQLSSGTQMEAIYADHANALMRMADTARKESVNTPTQKKDPAAAKAYTAEVASLTRKIEDAQARAPLERKAGLIANAEVELLKKDNPTMTKEQESKAAARALANARQSLGGTRPKFEITDAEWEAIQANAVSKSTLQKVLRYTDQDKLKERSMPRDKPALSDTKVKLAQSRLSMGYTLSEVADSLGVSVSALSSALYD